METQLVTLGNTLQSKILNQMVINNLCLAYLVLFFTVKLFIDNK